MNSYTTHDIQNRIQTARAAADQVRLVREAQSARQPQRVNRSQWQLILAAFVALAQAAVQR